MAVFLAQVDNQVAEGNEVQDEGVEKLLLDGLEVAVPQELDEHSDLTRCENVVVICVSEDLNESLCVVADEHPVEVQQLDLDLLEVACVCSFSLIILARHDWLNLR